MSWDSGQFDFVDGGAIFEGADWVFDFTLYDGDPSEFGGAGVPEDEQGDPLWTPVDLTGGSARMVVRRREDAGAEGGELILELTTANGRIALGGAAGTVSLLVEAADTDGLDMDRGVYRLDLIDPTGAVSVLLTGEVQYRRNINRTGQT